MMTLEQLKESISTVYIGGSVPSKAILTQWAQQLQEQACESDYAHYSRLLSYCYERT